MEMIVYEPVKSICKICNIRDAVLLPFCVDGDREFVYPVCLECRDKIMYTVIPVTTKMDEGFICLNDVITLKNKPILTKYGKKLMEQNKE